MAGCLLPKRLSEGNGEAAGRAQRETGRMRGRGELHKTLLGIGLCAEAELVNSAQFFCVFLYFFCGGLVLRYNDYSMFFTYSIGRLEGGASERVFPSVIV